MQHSNVYVQSSSTAGREKLVHPKAIWQVRQISRFQKCVGVLSSALAMSLVYVQKTTSYTIQALTPKTTVKSATINILKN